MTDDEAFIRAIVDSPGDDTPRLVYADWQDERDDPRSPYLRAETEWAKPWRTGQRPADNPQLREMAKGLDPVWVARVSRPPLGVCCDHVRFTDRGPVLSQEEIAEIETQLQGRFPTDFRAFILNTNGGRLDPPFCRDPYSAERDGPLSWEVEDIFAVCRPGEYHPPGAVESGSLDVRSQREWLEWLYMEGGGEGPNRLIEGMVPLAQTHHNLGYFLLAISGPNAGAVFHFRDYCHHFDDPAHLEQWLPTFAEFLGVFGPDLDNYNYVTK